jgi:hypothetical protein
MSTVIYKYQVGPNGATEMPRGAKILSTGFQQRNLFVWALVDPEAEHVVRLLHVEPTGGAPPSSTAIFIGTVFLDWLVFHVFDRGERPGKL